MDIVVSGIGMVTPLGSDTKSSWGALLDSKTGIVSEAGRLVARILNFSENGARSRVGDFALLAAREALESAGLLNEKANPCRIGCVVSQSKPILKPVVSSQTVNSGGEDACDFAQLDPSLLLSSFTGWSTESLIRREFGLEGPTANVVAACASGVVSIQWGLSWLLSGLCDAVLVGASESSLFPLYETAFRQMGVLAEGLPTAVKPFDQNRCGFAMGEGAAVLLIETGDACSRRGHRALARLKSVKALHSGHDLVRLDDEGRDVARLISATRVTKHRALYINAHGTATRLNDMVEARGITQALGEDPHDVYVSSTKAATGHLLGAAGALEAAFAVLALRDQVAPPTLHVASRLEDCKFTLVTHRAKWTQIEQALSLSYGFGGQMGAVLFERLNA